VAGRLHDGIDLERDVRGVRTLNFFLHVQVIFVVFFRYQSATVRLFMVMMFFFAVAVSFPHYHPCLIDSFLYSTNPLLLCTGSRNGSFVHFLVHWTR